MYVTTFTSEKFRITSEFEAVEDVREGVHTGIDLAMEVGTKLRSVTDGIVTEIFDGSDSIGKGVKITDGYGREFIYGHMSKVKVRVGEIVEKAGLIGESGNTGNSTGPHLHFAVQENGVFINPKEYKPLLDTLSGNINPSDLPWWDVAGRVTLSVENKLAAMQLEIAEMALAGVKLLLQTVVDLSFFIALLGGGILILVRGIAGIESATQKFWLLQMSNILIATLLSGVKDWEIESL